MTDNLWTLEVRPSELNMCALRREKPKHLQPDQVLVHIDHLALTANTMTYAALGELVGYWSLFPTRPGWGRIPAWGHGHVVESLTDGVEPGLRLFGLFPMSTCSVLTVRRSRLGLRETSPHRVPLNPVYNRYATALEKGEEALETQAVFHPLFIMSFVLATYLEEVACFGADAVVIVSASSKTALGVAHLLAGAGRKLSLIGITAARHLDWVEECGLFDRRLPYDSVGRLEQVGRCIVVDFSGNTELLGHICWVLGSRCVRVIGAGGTHGGTMEMTKNLATPHEMFFAPPHIERRVKEWGPQEFDRRFQQALEDFVSSVGRRYSRRYADGAEAMADAYRDLQRGLVPAATLSIARPSAGQDARA